MRGIAREVFALISALLIFGTEIRYCWQIVRGKANPTITMWIIFELGVAMSLVTYLSSREHSFISNIGNTSDIFMVSAILGTLIIKRRGEKLIFSKTEQTCLVIAIVVFGIWVLSGNAKVANIGFQILMVIAYWPVIRLLWLWKEAKSPEPFGTWLVSGTAAICGFITALLSKNLLAEIYIGRALLLICVLLFLIRRIEWRNRSAKT